MKHELLFLEKKECCGCGACTEICPRGILKMESDEEGYRYSVITERDKCIHCGLCEKVCPIHGQEEPAGPCLEIIAAKGSAEERRKSSSGAVFPLMAQEVLDRGGVVAGAVYGDGHRVEHRIVRSDAEMQAMRGSKYAQSDMETLFSDVVRELEQKKTVLFTGLPCQTEALRRFCRLKKGEDEHLILCDIICGKVPSPGVWNEYVSHLEKKYGGSLTKFVCRDKDKGWQYQSSKVVVGGRNVSAQAEREDAWMQLFVHSALCRPSCYRCPFTRLERQSDLTIGDFWGVEKSLPDFTDARGVSLILVHTEKGRALADSVKPKMEWRPSNEHDCMQERLQRCTKAPADRDAFWELYRTGGIEALLNKYGRRSLAQRVLYRDLLPAARKIGLYDLLLNTYHKLANK